MDSPVPLMHHDLDRSWITDPNSDHPKGTHPKYQEKRFCKYFFGSVQIISRLNSQSKFQMFTLFTDCHVGGLKRSSNMATPY